MSEGECKEKLVLDNVPVQFHDVLLSDARKSLAHITASLQRCIELNDLEKGGRFYVRQLDSYLADKYPFFNHERVSLVNLLVKIMLTCEDPHVSGFAASVAAKLLKKTLENCTPQDEPLDMEIEWRPLYDRIWNTFTDPGTIPKMSTELQNITRKDYAKLVAQARRFFPKSATEEILALTTPLLGSFDAVNFRVQALLQLFLPFNYPDEVVRWIMPFFGRLDDVDMCNDTLYVWFELLSKASKVTVGKYDWSPLLPKLFNLFLQCINLQMEASSSPHGNRQWPGGFFTLLNRQGRSAVEAIGVAMGRFCIFNMYEGSASLELTTQFLHSVITYFHPSNVGHWSNVLGTFLHCLGYYYTRRVALERDGKATYETQYHLKRDDTAMCELLLPVALMAMYSKSPRMVLYAGVTLRDLAVLHPSFVLPKLLEEFYPSLENLEQPHRMYSTLKSLIMLSRPLVHREWFPQGGDHLQRLLVAVLPAIDSADIIKTSSALSWLRDMFSNVPFIDAMETDKLPSGSNSSTVHHLTDGMQESEDDARRTTMSFAEWSREFLAKIIESLETADKFSKKSAQDVAFAQILNGCLEAFFSSISKTIFIQSCEAIKKFVLVSHKFESCKYFGMLLKNSGFARPKLSLSILFIPIADRIVNKSNGEWQLVASAAESELKWFTYILSQLVKRAGADDSLLPYMGHIRAIASLTNEHKDKTIRKYGARVLRGALQAMSTIYPAELRPFSPKEWSEEVQWKHWQKWGMYSENEGGMGQLDIVWHVPSEKEVKEVGTVVAEELQPCVDDINAFINAPHDEAAEEKLQDDMKNLEKRLKSIRNIATGVVGMLGVIEGEAEEEEEEKGPGTQRKDGGVALTKTPRTPLLPSIQVAFVKETPTVSLRTALTELCLALNEKLLTLKSKAKGDFVKVWTTLVKVMDLMLAVYGPGSEKYSRKRSMMAFQRFWNRENFYDKKVHVRPIKVGMAALQMDYRSLSQMQPKTNETVKKLMRVMQALSINDFEKLRRKACDSLMDGMARFRPCIDMSLNSMYEVLKDKDADEKQVTGAIEMLSRSRPSAWVSRNLDSSSAFMLTVCQHGEQHNEDKVQALVHNLFMHSLGSQYWLSVAIAPLEGGEVEGEALRNEGIMKKNKELKGQYVALLEQLVAFVLQGEKGEHHWRYLLMSSAYLLNLLREDIPEDVRNSPVFSDLVMFFCRGIVNELAPLRRLCIMAITRLLQHHNRNARKVETATLSSPAAIASTLSTVCVVKEGVLGMETPTVEALKEASFCDYNFSGWAGDQLITRKSPSTSSSLPPFIPTHVMEQMQTFLRKEMPQVVKTLVSNHPSLSKASNSGGRGGHGSKQGAGDAIGKRVYHRTGSKWPFTRVHATSNAFDQTHVRFCRHLVEAMPSLLLEEEEGSLMKEMKALVADTHEGDSQCTGAELLTGMVRGVKHAAPHAPAGVMTQLEAALRRALASCQPDCVNHWRDAVQLMVSNCDPRRVAWIVNLLVNSAFTASEPFEDTPSVFYKNLRFTEALLIEGAWRLAPIGAEMFNRLKRGWMHHPYQQVRQEVGHVLSLLCRNYHLKQGGGKEVIDDFVAYVTAALEKTSYLNVSATDVAASVAAVAADAAAGGDGDDANDAAEELKAMDVSGEEEGEGSKKRKRDEEDEKVGKDKLKHDQHLIETSLYWMIACFYGADLQSYTSAFHALLPHVVRAQHHPDPTCASLAKMCAKMYAWKRCPAPLLQGVIKALKGESKSPSWHVRVSVAKFVLVFAPRHSLILTEKQVDSLARLCRDLMQDAQLEVRQAASTAFGSIISSTVPNEEKVRKLQKRFMVLAKTKLIKKGQGKGSEALEAINKRHAGVLGLSAFVKCHPYDLPSWLPAILAYLANHINDRQPIKGALEQVFSDFRRTHKDMWHIFKEKFTEEELEAYQGVSLAPSYFA